MYCLELFNIHLLIGYFSIVEYENFIGRAYDSGVYALVPCYFAYLASVLQKRL